MAAGGSFFKGETIRATFTVTPTSGTVATADVYVTGVLPDGTFIAWTGAGGTVTSPATNTFRIEYAIPTDAPDGDTVLVLRTYAPSPVTAYEIAYQVLPTAL